MRYLTLSPQEKQAMLDSIGIKNVDEFFKDIPNKTADTGTIKSFPAMTESALNKEFAGIADKNMNTADSPCFLGAGAYHHYIPAVVDYLISRGEFLTSYTPYQPEVSQGTLQVLFEFQTQVARLTGMDVANSSMYDGATATFEAAAMAVRITNRKQVIISGGLHPDFAKVTASCSKFSGTIVKQLPISEAIADNEVFPITSDTACVIVQVPDFFGNIHDYTALAERCHKEGALLIIAFTEPVALAALKPLSEMGADIVVGEGLSLAGHLNFGGPALGLFATKEQYIRNMPGRLIGETVDSEGKRCFVLTLSTREQHIRREKATSNICTNSGLMATAFSIHLTLLGEKGIKGLAALNHAKAVKLASILEKVEGVSIVNKTFFNEFLIRLEGQSAKAAVLRMAERGILGGVPLSRFYEDTAFEDYLLLAVTETVSDDDMNTLAEEL